MHSHLRTKSTILRILELMKISPKGVRNTFDFGSLEIIFNIVKKTDTQNFITYFV